MELTKLTRISMTTEAENMEEEGPLEEIIAAGVVEAIDVEADT